MLRTLTIIRNVPLLERPACHLNQDA